MSINMTDGRHHEDALHVTFCPASVKCPSSAKVTLFRCVRECSFGHFMSRPVTCFAVCDVCLLHNGQFVHGILCFFVVNLFHIFLQEFVHWAKTIFQYHGNPRNRHLREYVRQLRSVPYTVTPHLRFQTFKVKGTSSRRCVLSPDLVTT